MGRQVGGQAPSRKSPRAGALSAARVRSSLPAGASVSASGKWAIAQAYPPRLCRRVLGSPAQSRTLGYGSRRARAPWSQRPEPRARRFLEGLPLQPRCDLAGSPAWSLHKPTPGSRVRRQHLCQGERCGSNTYIFTFLIVIASFPGRARGCSGREEAGVSFSCRGPKLRGGDSAWAPPERGARRGFRCAREVGGLQCRDWRARRSFVMGRPRAPLRALSSSPSSRRRQPRPAWPGLSFPDCKLRDRLLISSLPQGVCVCGGGSRG